MQALDIDFRHRTVTRTGTALLLAGVLTATAALTWLATVSAQRATAVTELNDLQRMLRRTPGNSVQASPREDRVAQDDVRNANTVLRQMTIPWDRLFAGLEASADPDVALLAVQPDVGNRLVRISGEARSLKGMLSYARRLEGAEYLGNVILLSHEVKVQDPQRPVVFSVSAEWSEQP